MWESVERLVSSGNAWFVLICLIMLVVSVRAGMLRYKSERLSFGKDVGYAERNTLRKQSQFAKHAVDGFYNSIPKNFGEFDEWRARYVMEICLDEIVDWIMLNHIEDTKSYISIKQDIIWNLIQKYVSHKKLTSDEFKADCYEEVEHIIKRLVEIRAEKE